MFADLLIVLKNELIALLSPIIAIILIALSLMLALIALKHFKIAMFLQDPTKSERFNKWHQQMGEYFDDIDDSAKAYVHTVQEANKYYQTYGIQDERLERARLLYEQRRDAYYFIKSLDRLQYRGFDDDFDD